MDQGDATWCLSFSLAPLSLPLPQMVVVSNARGPQLPSVDLRSRTDFRGWVGGGWVTHAHTRKKYANSHPAPCRGRRKEESRGRRPHAASSTPSHRGGHHEYDALPSPNDACRCTVNRQLPTGDRPGVGQFSHTPRRPTPPAAYPTPRFTSTHSYRQDPGARDLDNVGRFSRLQPPQESPRCPAQASTHATTQPTAWTSSVRCA